MAQETRIVVYNEYALGFIYGDQPNKFSPISWLQSKGAPIRISRGPIYYDPTNDKIRLAKLEDFAEFRVHFSIEYVRPPYVVDITPEQRAVIRNHEFFKNYSSPEPLDITEAMAALRDRFPTLEVF